MAPDAEKNERRINHGIRIRFYRIVSDLLFPTMGHRQPATLAAHRHDLYRQSGIRMDYPRLVSRIDLGSSRDAQAYHTVNAPYRLGSTVLQIAMNNGVLEFIHESERAQLERLLEEPAEKILGLMYTSIRLTPALLKEVGVNLSAEIIARHKSFRLTTCWRWDGELCESRNWHIVPADAQDYVIASGMGSFNVV